MDSRNLYANKIDIKNVYKLHGVFDKFDSFIFADFFKSCVCVCVCLQFVVLSHYGP